MVKVKFLKSVGAYQVGDVVELADEMAEQVLKPMEYMDGEQLVSIPKAIRLSDAEKLEKAEVTAEELKKMTAADMAKLGKKNIVVTPADPAFEAKLTKLRGEDEEAGKAQKAAVKAKGKGKAAEQE